MIKVYDYYQEENKALEERFTLASERIYEIQNEAELCSVSYEKDHEGNAYRTGNNLELVVP